MTKGDGRVLYEVIKITAAKYLLVATGAVTKATVGWIGDIAFGRAHHQNLGLYRFRGIAEKTSWVEYDNDRSWVDQTQRLLDFGKISISLYDLSPYLILVWLNLHRNVA